MAKKIDPYRQQLNERFIEAFEFLTRHGVIEKNNPNKSISMFAENILGNANYGHVIAAHLSGEKLVQYGTVRRMCAHYRLNEQYLLLGTGQMEFQQSDAVRVAHSQLAETKKELQSFLEILRKNMGNLEQLKESVARSLEEVDMEKQRKLLAPCPPTVDLDIVPDVFCLED